MRIRECNSRVNGRARKAPLNIVVSGRAHARGLAEFALVKPECLTRELEAAPDCLCAVFALVHGTPLHDIYNPMDNPLQMNRQVTATALDESIRNE